jgi:hypothetical protein
MTRTSTENTVGISRSEMDQSNLQNLQFAPDPSLQKVQTTPTPTAPVGVDSLLYLAGDLERFHKTGTYSDGQTPIRAAGILRSLSASPQPGEGVAEGLKDANIVHINMLRSGIAKLHPVQIGHLYRGEDAVAVVAEVKRQNPEAFAQPGEGGSGELLRKMLAGNPPAEHAVLVDERDLKALAALSIVGGGGALRPSASVPSRTEAANVADLQDQCVCVLRGDGEEGCGLCNETGVRK